jgi:hypothetical protein
MEESGAFLHYGRNVQVEKKGLSKLAPYSNSAGAIT